LNLIKPPAAMVLTHDVLSAILTGIIVFTLLQETFG
jgi:hypothetical protein